MKKLFGLIAVSAVLAGCGQVVPQDTQSTHITSTDVAVIKKQLEFGPRGDLQLRADAADHLTTQQLDFAQHALPSINSMAASSNWEFGDRADGSLYPTGELAEQLAKMDPKLSAQACSSYISSVSWEYRGGAYSATAMNVPTTCGRAQSYFYVMDAWAESVDKTPASTNWGKVYGTNSYWSMYNQFVCHTDYAFWKDSWNLEPARPNVGYQATVSAQCNPE